MRIVWTLPQSRALKQERRYVCEGMLRLLGQRKRLERLRDAGLDTGEAEKLLHILEDSQLAMSAHLRRRERER